MIMQIIINGLLIGGLYATVGIGFSLVWGVMRVINLTHGGMIMLGAYISYTLFEYAKIDPFLSIPISMIVLYFLGIFMEKYIVDPIIKAGIFMTITLTFGLEMILENIILLIWSGNYRSITTFYSGNSFEFLGATVSLVRFFMFIAAIAITIILYLFMYKTKTGSAIRATALNREGAQMVGVNISRIYRITFGIGAALAGASGALLSSVYTISPSMASSLIGKAFIVTVLGGLGSVNGAIFGGIVLGLAESFGSEYLGTGFQEATGFILLVLVLALRPQGLLGRKFFT